MKGCIVLLCFVLHRSKARMPQKKRSYEGSLFPQKAPATHALGSSLFSLHELLELPSEQQWTLKTPQIPGLVLPALANLTEFDKTTCSSVFNFTTQSHVGWGTRRPYKSQTTLDLRSSRCMLTSELHFSHLSYSTFRQL